MWVVSSMSIKQKLEAAEQRYSLSEMTVSNCEAILSLGIFFILFGLASIFFSKREERKYYDSILSRRDIREYITHEPERLWLTAWRIGGRISLILGIPLAIAGGVLWLL